MVSIQNNHKKNLTRLSFLAIIIVYFASPFLLSEYLLYLVVLMSVMIIVAEGLNVMIGFAGLFSFGQPGFMAFGAYIGAILAVHFKWIPFPLIMLMAGSTTAVLGLIIGFPCLRLSGFYLAMATFGFSAAIFQLINYAKPFTGGYEGMYAPSPSLGSLHFGSTRAIFYITAVCVVCVLVVVRFLAGSRTGRAWKAIRDDEIAASSMGIELRREKLKVFAFGAFLAGIAGVLYSYTIRYLETSYFDQMGLPLFLILVLGGIGEVYGPVYGSIFMTILPQIMGGKFSQNMSLVYGFTLVIFVLLAPHGFYGIWYRIKKTVPAGFNIRAYLFKKESQRGNKD